MQRPDRINEKITVHRIRHRVCGRVARLFLIASPIIGRFAAYEAGSPQVSQIGHALAVRVHLAGMGPGIPVRAESVPQEFTPGMAYQHLLIWKRLLKEVAKQCLDLRRGRRAVVLAPLADNAHFNVSHACICVPTDPQSLHQARDALDKLTTGIVIRRHINGPVFSVTTPVQVHARNHLLIPFTHTLPRRVTPLLNPVNTVRFTVFYLIPTDIAVDQGRPLIVFGKPPIGETLHGITQRTRIRFRLNHHDLLVGSISANRVQAQCDNAAST